MCFAALGAAEVLSVDPRPRRRPEPCCAMPRAFVEHHATRTGRGPGRSRACATPTRSSRRCSSRPARCSTSRVGPSRAATSSAGSWTPRPRGGASLRVPVGGWAPGEARPGFDQQPIEVAALADACARACDVTGDRAGATRCVRCAAWFDGDNDALTPMRTRRPAEGSTGWSRSGATRTRARSPHWRCCRRDSSPRSASSPLDEAHRRNSSGMRRSSCDPTPAGSSPSPSCPGRRE